MVKKARENTPAPRPVRSAPVEAFLAEYRDLVQRHGMGLFPQEGDAVVVDAVPDPDAHVLEIQEA